MSTSKRQHSAKIKWYEALTDAQILADLVVEAQAGNTAVLCIVALEKAIVTSRLANGGYLESYSYISLGYDTQLNCVHKGLSCTFSPVTCPQSEVKTRAVYLSILHLKYLGQNHEVETKHQMNMSSWRGNNETYGIDGKVVSD